MTWTQLLKTEMAGVYSTTALLLDRVDPNCLDWKPATGSNWMTMGQLLKHIGDACGAGCRAFLTGDWGLPPGVSVEDLKPEEMLPPAEKLPAVASVEEAKKALAGDRTTALEAIDLAGEAQLEHKLVAAPWAPGVECALGRHFLQMVQHLDRHKTQLFYYLKLQGQPVSTVDLWGEPQV
ncbi:MAG: DinB family protein [Bryobacteraceae bacterium]|nr:DinB family protein [Bryobacteraceae bacterium]